MYQENGGFDQSSSMHGGGWTQADDAFSQTIEEQSYPQNEIQEMVHDASNWQEMEHKIELQYQLDIEQCFSNKNGSEIQEMVHDASNWTGFNGENGQYHQHQNSAAASLADASYPTVPDLLNIFSPPSSVLPNFSQKSPSFLGFTGAEKHRRVLLNDKYQGLRALVPNSSKNDRASIVGDAIIYINELKRTLTELKGLVEKNRCARERLKRHKMEENGSGIGDMDGSSLRSTWLHRKSKNTEVDVRIIDDEITVKLVQQKRINCLLFVSKVLDELQLDLHHVAGGLIGDYYSYLFNSKICEGSIVYASAVANKLIEVVDKQYAAVPPPTTY